MMTRYVWPASMGKTYDEESESDASKGSEKASRCDEQETDSAGEDTLSKASSDGGEGRRLC